MFKEPEKLRNAKNLLLISVLGLSIYFSACVKDPVIPNEEEVITTLRYTLTSDSVGVPIVLTFQDLDGDGGNAPLISGGTLAANTTYFASLELLNEVENPAENITDEIVAEAEAHQFFFQTTLDGLTVNYEDTDADGNPIGIATKVTTTNATSGTITIILKHEPNKTAANVANGDITNAGGETDIQVTFAVDVQ
ncbi:MAG: type 1 periplasmic binding fold superfamily protein [Saprospiraceae bacterium]|nr:type 1 periplasmic binding fold superfamily protein [Saprospiraceae bacterium]